ncbi:chromo domain-containing protein cec-3-like isoform X2 [Drosophila innubila]|uniref:chromo domain-containing protein cec-3-like isoform X2 n=1 Tax=Drosophila innubila TaxID=198719 RepID=UPI00148E0880|nr:chromo domain-containing protein cec-3-like isoform X2 [Drosophila innubila]
MAEFNRQPSPNAGKKKREYYSAAFGRGKKGKKNKSQEIHSVEKVLDKRYVNGRCELLLKWMGYSQEQSTWEPMENLTNDCMGLLTEFEIQCAQKSHAAAPLKKQSPSNQNSNLGLGEDIDLSDSTTPDNSSVSSCTDSSDNEGEDHQRASNLKQPEGHGMRTVGVKNVGLSDTKISLDSIKAQARQWQDTKMASKTSILDEPNQQLQKNNLTRRKTMYADCTDVNTEHVSPIQRLAKLTNSSHHKSRKQ